MEGKSNEPHVEEEETKPKEEEDAKEVAERRVWLMDLMKQSLGLWPTPEQVLDTLDMDGVVKFIKSGKCKNIVTMAGAGISTSAGIPDFRSPTTGLYDNLQKYNLPHPQAVFDIGYFWKNPEPFFHLAKEMWPGVFKVVYQTIRDIGKLKDWKPGVVTCSLVKSNKGSKSGPNNQSPYKMDKGMGQDVIQEVVINPKTQDYTEEVVPQQYTRHWNREDNGCCWMLQTSQDKCLAMFFLVQPVEDMDSCLVTILVHNVSSVGASQVACLLGSLKDYLSLRKVKCTPLTSIRMPNFNNNCHTNNFADSSSDEERDKQFYDRFSSLNDKQKSLVLQKSESILRLRTNSQGKMTRRSLQQRRSQSDTDIIGIVMGDTDSRSQPLIKPADNAQNSSNLLHSNSYGEARVSQRTSPMDVDSEHSQTESGDQNSQKSGQDDLEQNSEKTGYNNGGIRGHGHGEDEGLLTREDEGLLTREEMDTDTGSVVSSIESETPQDDVFDLSDKQPTTPSDVVKFMTLANQSAADILALAVRVSNIELRKSQSQQTESSGGWAFWGLETDVVIFKKILNRSNSLFSFVGKGLISASPQRVFEAIKNPRTRFTYDESLKKVDVLSSITDKAKIVYFYHELVNMFKKECFDFCVLQNERMDGEKFVIAMQSVDNGLPVPSGTERVQMLPSGWIIEPVTRDNKMYSMATYVMQVPPDDACRANMIAGRRYWRRYSILRGCLDTISSIGCFSAIILDPLKSI